MKMEDYLDIEKLDVGTVELYENFRNTVVLSDKLDNYNKELEYFFYMYELFNQSLKDNFKTSEYLIKHYGENHQEVLEDWNNYLTPKGFRLYKQSGNHYRKLRLFSGVGGSLVSIFTKPRPKRPLTKARNIKGLQAKRETMTQRELLKELLMTEINQKTNHIQFQVTSLKNKKFFTFKIAGYGFSDLHFNLSDSTARRGINAPNRIESYAMLQDVDPTQTTLTRNPKKVLTKLLEAQEDCSILDSFKVSQLKRTLTLTQHLIDVLNEDVSDDELSELAIYCEHIYDSKNISTKDFNILSNLSQNKRLLFTHDFNNVIEMNIMLKAHITFTALHVVKAINNPSDSKLESIPQDIIDFSVKHIDEIVAELINYVNVLEKYGYAVTD